MDISDFLEKINGFVWGNGLIFLLLATGIFYTIKLRGIQFRMIPLLVRSMKSSDKGEKNDGITQLKTVCMSLGAAMGTGNITGVAAAIALGGSGAVFWMWVSAFFGMAAIYAENYLGAIYRTKDIKGSIAYIRSGLGSKGIAAVFAVFCIFASLGMGGMVQISSFSESLAECSNINGIIIAVISFILIFAVTSGGASRIGGAAQVLLPAVTAAYSIAALGVIVVNSDKIFPVLSDIVSQAFSFKSAAGGVGGFALSRAVSVGIRRGIFSNEAGLGSSPILHSASCDQTPSAQGLWSMLEVFIDTFVCCSLTAFAVLTSGEGSLIDVFSCILGANAGIFLTISLGILAFCTIIGWYYCGETACVYVLGSSKKRFFTVLFSLSAASGAIIKAADVWTLSDIFNGLMAFPNILALVFLCKKVKRE